LDLDSEELCNNGTTSEPAEKLVWISISKGFVKRQDFISCGKTRLNLDLEGLCNKGTTSVGPLKPIISMLGFSPCRSQSRFPPPERPFFRRRVAHPKLFIISTFHQKWVPRPFHSHRGKDGIPRTSTIRFPIRQFHGRASRFRDLGICSPLPCLLHMITLPRRTMGLEKPMKEIAVTVLPFPAKPKSPVA
jgi:hypothetical protein